LKLAFSLSTCATCQRVLLLLLLLLLLLSNVGNPLLQTWSTGAPGTCAPMAAPAK
jgi:hypothetical protein